MFNQQQYVHQTTIIKSNFKRLKYFFIKIRNNYSAFKKKNTL